MLEALQDREARGEPIRVALVGAGSMGLGIAWQIGRTPGMRLVSVADIDLTAARRAAEAYGRSFIVDSSDHLRPDPGVTLVSRSPMAVLDAGREVADVFVEATNTVSFAAEACLAAARGGTHVVLMNAEVDLALGPLLQHAARAADVVVTSDAGDQHGVLARMLEEIQLWGFRIVMAGNIKGFLDRYATAQGLLHEAAIRNLNPVQCCAYTDGSKLGVEMAIISNATGLIPWVPGMEGPRAKDVHEVFERFDFDRYGDQGVVDYLLGAEPGGGVFVVGHCADPLQAAYLHYYKMGSGPYYLFYRPYHLCHLETTRAIAMAALYRRPVLTPSFGRVADVYAHAKRDVAAGEEVEHGLGGDQFYGLIAEAGNVDREGWVPIALLEAGSAGRARIERPLRRDQPLTRDDVALPDTPIVRLFAEQQEMTRALA
jgi:predicted homoserine dehydrogenase-like protein